MAVGHGAAVPGTGCKRKILSGAIVLMGGPGRLAVASLHTAAINCLALTGPLYMLVLFDRVLPSGRHEQLVAATAAMLVLYGLGAGFDVARHRVLLNGARRAERCLTAATTRKLASMQAREIAAVGTLLRGQVPAALCDAPWVPLYLMVLVLLHPLFGALAIVGAAAMAGCILLVDRRCGEGRGPERPSTAAPKRPSRSNWVVANAQRRALVDAAAQRTGLSAALLRTLRPALQSAMLGLGAYLVMIGACRAGSVLAAAILLSRLLAPVETILAHWRSIVAAWQSAEGIAEALERAGARGHRRQSDARDEGSAAGVKIIVRQSPNYARSATRGGTRSTSSDLRPTAQ